MENAMAKEKPPVTEADLHEAIAFYHSKGYRVISQTPSSAQLVKKKKLNFILSVFLFLFFIVPFIIYLLWYASQKEQLVHLQYYDGTLTVSNATGRRTVFKTKPRKRQLKRALLTWFENVAYSLIWVVLVILIVIIIVITL